MRKLKKEFENLKKIEAEQGLTSRQSERMEVLYEEIYS